MLNVVATQCCLFSVLVSLILHLFILPPLIECLLPRPDIVLGFCLFYPTFFNVWWVHVKPRHVCLGLMHFQIDCKLFFRGITESVGNEVFIRAIASAI